MKKTIYIFSIILAGSLAALGQQTVTVQEVLTSKEKAVSKTGAQTAEEREPFDPNRDPNIDLSQALAGAQASGKRIILDVGGEWCGWCRHMDKFFKQNPALARLRDENYIWVKVNYSEENYNDEFLSKYPPIKGYPHLFVLDADGALLQSQDTGALEGEKSYDLQKFTDFLKKWSPAKISENAQTK